VRPRLSPLPSPVNFGDPRLPERFWSKVSPCPMSGCWLWTAAAGRLAYGRIGVGSRRPGGGRGTRQTHRLAYETLVGPTSMMLDHLCRVTLCCNPLHLEPVSNQENSRRGNCGKKTGELQRAKTHCPSGHEYSEENTRVNVAGERECKECRRAASARYRERKRAA
jgi:hypothetical protein